MYTCVSPVCAVYVCRLLVDEYGLLIMAHSVSCIMYKHVMYTCVSPVRAVYVCKLLVDEYGLLIMAHSISCPYRKVEERHLKTFSDTQMPFPYLSYKVMALQLLSPIMGGFYSLPGHAYLDKAALFQTRPM